MAGKHGKKWLVAGITGGVLTLGGLIALVFGLTKDSNSQPVVPTGGNPDAGDTTGMNDKTNTAEQMGGCFLQTYRNATQDNDAVVFSVIKDGDKMFVTGVTGKNHDQYFKQYFVSAQAGLKSLGTYAYDADKNPLRYSTADPETDIKMCNWTFSYALGERIITPSNYYKLACEIVNFYNPGPGSMPLFVGESKDTGEGEHVTPLTIASQNYKGEYTFAQMNLYTNNQECEEGKVDPVEAIFQNGAYINEYSVDAESYMISSDYVACSYSLINENANQSQNGQDEFVQEP